MGWMRTVILQGKLAAGAVLTDCGLMAQPRGQKAAGG
jgi:hypothetical protein